MVEKKDESDSDDAWDKSSSEDEEEDEATDGPNAAQVEKSESPTEAEEEQGSPPILAILFASFLYFALGQKKTPLDNYLRLDPLLMSS